MLSKFKKYFLKKRSHSATGPQERCKEQSCPNIFFPFPFLLDKTKQLVELLVTQRDDLGKSAHCSFSPYFKKREGDYLSHKTLSLGIHHHHHHQMKAHWSVCKWAHGVVISEVHTSHHKPLIKEDVKQLSNLPLTISRYPEIAMSLFENFKHTSKNRI